MEIRDGWQPAWGCKRLGYFHVLDQLFEDQLAALK
jgi:hypothetical protein